MRCWTTAAAALVPRRRHFIGAASTLRNPVLASQLGPLELGGWSPAPATIDFVERVIRDQRPDLVPEFGSGISTACLTQLMRELHGERGRVLVLAIEEQDEHARETRARLAALG